jgi:integrase
LCKQHSPFRVKTILTPSGERLPVLLSRQSGIPLFDPTVWTVAELRGRHVASNTILQALRSLVFLYITLDRRKIDLSQRLVEGNFLTYEEIEEIVRVCKSTLASCIDVTSDITVLPPRKILSLEKARMSMTRRKLATDVDPATAAIRLNYIRQYLVWRMEVAILRVPASARTNLLALREIIENTFKNQTPQVTGRKHISQRMGLDAEAQALLIRVIDPDSLDNPWGSAHTKVRNALIVRSLLELGVRRSELLGVRIKDISAQGHEIKILRRPDDKDDPRLYEPNTKTRDRLLALSPELFQRIRDYIYLRRTMPGARRHDFLLVANGTGAPLSKSEFNRLFHPLQAVSPMLQYVIPHLLRHTFCENLCEDLDKNRVPAEEWEPILRQLGGWSDTSTTPRRYTKRFAQRKANEAILSMQGGLSMKVRRVE